MKVTSKLSIFMLQSLNRQRLKGGGQGNMRQRLPEAFLGLSLRDPPSPKKHNGLAWEKYQGRATSYTLPNFWLSPKCEVLILQPKSTFNLPDNGNCFHERMSDSIRFIGLVKTGSGEDLPIFELICTRAGRGRWGKPGQDSPAPHPALTSPLQAGSMWSCLAGS